MLGFGPLATSPLAALSGGSFSGKVILSGSNAVPNQIFPNAGHVAFGGSQAIAVTAAPRMSWMGVEALHIGAAADRVTWAGAEILRTTTFIPTQSQVTWLGAEALHTGSAADRVTWIGAETLHDGLSSERVTWMGAEVLRSVLDRPPDSGFVYLIC